MWIVLLVARWVRNLKVLHGQTRHVVHWNLKVHRHRADLFPTFGSCGLWERDLGNEAVLNTSLELLDGPFSDLILSLILAALSHLLGFGKLKSNICS